MVLAALILAQATSPVLSARKHLDAGQLDQVLFDLDGKHLDEKSKPPAADVLGQAARTAFGQGDSLLSLQFAQMALRLRPGDLLALEVAARAARAQEQFGPAEQYADEWMARSNTSHARLFRAALAMDNAEWARCVELAHGVNRLELAGEEPDEWKAVSSRCETEVAEKREGRSQIAALEGAVANARRSASQQLRAQASPEFPLVYCVLDSDCPSLFRCSPVVLGSDESWQQTTVELPDWFSPQFDEQGWHRAVVEGPSSVYPWLSRATMPSESWAMWIWDRDTHLTGDTDIVYFRKRFAAPAGLLSVTVSADNGYELYLDGTKLGAGHDWAHPDHYEFPLLPNKLEHVLAMRVVNDGGAGGLLLDARVGAAYCQPARIVSPRTTIPSP